MTNAVSNSTELQQDLEVIIAAQSRDLEEVERLAQAQKQAKEQAYTRLERTVSDKAYLLESLKNIKRICNDDNSDLRKIASIIEEVFEALEVST